MSKEIPFSGNGKKPSKNKEDKIKEIFDEEGHIKDEYLDHIYHYLKATFSESSIQGSEEISEEGFIEAKNHILGINEKEVTGCEHCKKRLKEKYPNDPELQNL